MMGMESSEEEERMFLVGFGPRPKRYGTTTTPSAARPSYSSLAYHTVLPTDTIQGLALRYGSSVTEIRRLNKLWSNESLYLKDLLVIPVLGEAGTSAAAAPPPTNGAASPRRRASSAKPAPAPSEPKEGSLSDFLSRIDATIRSTAKNVQKLERASTVDKALEGSEDVESGVSSAFSSRSSSVRARVAAKYDLGVSRTAEFGGEATDVRTEGRRILASLEQLQRSARGKGEFEEI